MSLRRVPWWAVGVVASVVVLAAGWLPAPDARDLAGRALPVLVFVAALTVVAELCAGAGLFEAAAGVAAQLARGRRPLLWVLVVVLATASTAVLSLDTTAVLLTPVVIALARRTGSSPLPFALAVLALANTASLVLPVSNLTNLLADHELRAAGVDYVRLMWPAALVCVVLTVLVLALRDRSSLRGTFAPTPTRAAPDRPLLATGGVVTLALAVAFVAGAPTAPTAVVAALVLLVATAARRRPLPVPPSRMVPWRMLLVVAALFVLVATAHAHGLGTALGRLSGEGQGPGALLRYAVVGAAAANAVNNLPAFLALEPAWAHAPLRLAALLVGTGAGPLITPWGSLATLLWWQRCRAAALDVPVGVVVRQGLVLAPLAVAGGVLALVAG